MKQIDEIIQSYHKNYKTLTIHQLLDFQDKLSTLFYNFAEELGDNLEDYVRKYGEYRVSFAKNFLENIAKKIDEKITSKEAEELAKEQSLWEWTAQMFAQAKIEKMKVQKSSIEKILSSVQQRISVAKQEFENSKK